MQRFDHILGIDTEVMLRVAELQVFRPDVIGDTLPLVLRGVANQWTALDRWTFKYLSDLGGERSVTLVYGNRELDKTQFVKSKFSDFLDELNSSNTDPTGLVNTLDLLQKSLLIYLLTGKMPVPPEKITFVGQASCLSYLFLQEV